MMPVSKPRIHLSFAAFLLALLVFSATSISAAGVSGLKNIGVTNSSASYQWNNQSGVNYTLAISSDSAFSFLTSSGVSGLNQNTTSYGSPTVPLQTNTLYFFKVKVSTDPDANYLSITTATLPNAPGAISFTDPPAEVDFTSITVTWGNNGNSLTPPTSYQAQISTGANFSIFQGSVTFNLYASLTGLSPDTSYYFRVKTFGVGGSSSAFNDVASTTTIDAVPPSAITYLTALTGRDAGTLTLQWIAPGDNGTTGQALSYDVRSSLDPNFDWVSAFDQADVVNSNIPVSGTYGTNESLFLDNLDPGVTYYFRIKTRDEAGNLSGLSVGATNFAGPPQATALIFFLRAGNLTSPFPTTSNGLNKSSGTTTNTGTGFTSGGSSTEGWWKLKPEVNLPNGNQMTALPSALSQETWIATTSLLYQTISTGIMTLNLRWQVQDINIKGRFAWRISKASTTAGSLNNALFLTSGTNGWSEERSTRTAPNANKPQTAVITSTITFSTDFLENEYLVLELAFRQVGTKNAKIFSLYIDTPTVSFGTPLIGDIKPPATITALSALTGATSSQISLSWIAPGNNGTVGTLISGSRFHISSTTVFADAVNDAFWNSNRDNPDLVISTSGVKVGDKNGTALANLRDGVTYYFRIWTRDQAGNFSAISNGATAQAQFAAKIPGTSTIVEVNYTSITVSWTANGNPLTPPTSYQIQASSSANFVPFVSSITFALSGTVISLLPNTTYNLRVRAFGVAGDSSDFNAVVSTQTRPDPTPPEPVTNLSALQGDPILGLGNLSWSAPSDFPTFGSPASYLVRYATWSFSDNEFNAVNILNAFPASNSPGQTENFPIPGLPSNSTVYFHIKSTDIAGNISNLDTTSPPAKLFVQPHLVISEVAPRANGINDEFVELYNPTTYSINLAEIGLKLWKKNITGVNSNIPLSAPLGIILSKGYYLLATSTNATNGVTVDSTFSATASNLVANETVYISTSEIADRGVIDMVGWGTSAVNEKKAFNSGTSYQPPTGGSIERKPGLLAGNGQDNNDNSSDFIQLTTIDPKNSQSSPLPDVTAPSAISDLTALSGTLDGDIRLFWTSPGDDGTLRNLVSGSVFSIRGSTNPISNFNTINPVNFSVDLSTVASFGSAQGVLVTGLNPGTTYYFAVIAKDESGNSSLWSILGANAKSSAPAADLPLSPPSNLNIFGGDAAISSITIRWTNPPAPLYVDDRASYRLYVASSEFASVIDSWVTLSSEVAHPLTQATTSQLAPNTTYFFRISAVDKGDRGSGLYSIPLESALSAIFSTATLARAPGFSGFVMFNSSATLNILPNNNPDGTLYQIQSSTDGFNSVVSSTQGAALTLTLFGLQANTTYQLGIVALNFNNLLSSRTIVTATSTLANVPGQNSFIAEAIGFSSITVQWTANGNQLTPPTSYQVQVSTDIGFSIFDSSITFNLQSTIFNLQSNTSYYFRVSAFHRGGGQSDFNATATTSTLAEPPDFAAFVSSEVALSSMTIRWDAKTNPPTVKYRIESSSNVNFTGAVGSSETFSLLVTTNSLLPNTTYYFRGSAINNNGLLTPFSTVRATATLSNPPLSALSTFTFVGIEEITAQWDNNGNPAQTNYLAEVSTVSDFSSGIVTSSSTFLISVTTRGLISNATYFFRVKSRNFSGRESDFVNIGSTKTVAITDVIPPANISDLTALTGAIDGQVQLSWTAVGNNGMSGSLPLESQYRIHASTANFFFFSSTMPAIAFGNFDFDSDLISTSGVTPGVKVGVNIDGLYPGTTWYFAVIVRDASNWNSWNKFAALNLSNFAPAQDLVLAAPVNINAFSVNRTSITISWTNPSAPSGFDDRDKYRLYSATADFSLPIANFVTSSEAAHPLASATTSSLIPNTSYFFRVSALDLGDKGDGRYSIVYESASATTFSTATLAAVPGTSAFDFVGVSSLTLSWNSGGNPSGTLYQAQVSTDSGFGVFSTSDTFTLSLTTLPLAANTTYFVRVKARNRQGVDTNYNAVISTSTSLLAPQFISFAGVTTGQIAANWNSQGNSASTLYTVTRSSAPDFTGSADTILQGIGVNTLTFANLSANTTYHFKGTALSNSALVKAFDSQPSTATLSRAPLFLSLPVAATKQVQVSWGANNNPDGTIYICEISTNATRAPLFLSSQTTSTSALFSQIPNNTTYYSQVKSRNWQQIDSAYTDLGSTATPLLPPTAVTGLRGTGASPNSIKWEWVDTTIEENDEEGFRVFTVDGGTSPVLPDETTFWIETGRDPNSADSAFVQAFNHAGTSNSATVVGYSQANVPSLALPAFSGITTGQIQASWGFGGNPGLTGFLVESSTSANHSPIFSSSPWSPSLTFNFANLSGNTTYYFQAKARNFQNLETAYTDLGSTSTLAAAPLFNTFLAVTTDQIRISWESQGNGKTTLYNITGSTTPDFTGADDIQLQGTGISSITFSNLLGNTSFYFKGSATNNNSLSANFVSQISTVTLARGVEFASISTTIFLKSVSLFWQTPVGNSPVVQYVVELSSDSASPGFSFISASSVTISTQASLTDLRSDTTYQAQISVLNRLGSRTPPNGVITFKTPSLPLIGFDASTTSLTVSWNKDLAPPGSEFLAENLTSAIDSGWQQNISSWTFTQLSTNTQYSFQVHWRELGSGASNFMTSGTTRTLSALPSNPIVVAVSFDVANIILVTGGNPTADPNNTEFAIFVKAAGTAHDNKYVPKSGDMNTSSASPVWQTFNQWGGSTGTALINLVPAASYNFQVKARNGNLVETGFSGISTVLTFPTTPKISWQTGLMESSWSNMMVTSFTARNSGHYHLKLSQSETETVPDSGADASAFGPGFGTNQVVTVTATAAGAWFFYAVGDTFGFGNPPSAIHSSVGAAKFKINIDTTPPLISNLRAQFSPTDTTPISDNSNTPGKQIYLRWESPVLDSLHESPIAGYSIILATAADTGDAGVPLVVLTTAPAAFFQVAFSSDRPTNSYYLRVKAKDVAGNWGNSALFTYKVLDDAVKPKVTVKELSMVRSSDGRFLAVKSSGTLSLPFDKAMKENTIMSSQTISLRGVRDSFQTEQNLFIDFALRYDSVTFTLGLTPLKPLPRGWHFELSITTQATDLAGNSIDTPIKIEFETSLDKSAFNRIKASDGKTIVELPPNALSEDFSVTVGIISGGTLPQAPFLHPEYASQTSLDIANQKIIRLLGPLAQPITLREFTAFSESGQPLKSNFSAPVTISVPYSDADNDSFIDGTNPRVRVDGLSLYVLDETNNLWLKFGNATLDPANKIIKSKVTHFSLYALIGSPAGNVLQSFAFPVPFKPSEGHTGITFAFLPDNGTIRIYTVAGELIRRIDFQSPEDGKVLWDVTNSAGEKLGSDLYIYTIQSGADKKTGKLMVIR